MNTLKDVAQTVATINNQNIIVFEENGTKYVAIKPICDALGVASNKQIEKIKSHAILGSTGTLRVSVADDEKSREMFSIPIKYVFGWLFTINPDNVKSEAKENLINYQKECYNVLYREFYEKVEFYQEKEKLKLKCALKIARVKNEVSDAKKEMEVIEQLDFKTWEFNKKQLSIDFNKEGGEL